MMKTKRLFASDGESESCIDPYLSDAANRVDVPNHYDMSESNGGDLI